MSRYGAALPESEEKMGLGGVVASPAQGEWEVSGAWKGPH